MIRVQFSARSDLGSLAIKTFERGVWSHVDAIMPDGNLLGARSDVVGEKPAGVQIRPPNYVAFDKVQAYGLPCSATQEIAFYTFLRGQVGKPYDEKAIVAFGLGRDWHNPDEWFCSELITAAVEASGFFPFPISEGFNFITPRDCELLISPWAQRLSSP
jgi:hypothetical protein